MMSEEIRLISSKLSSGRPNWMRFFGPTKKRIHHSGKGTVHEIVFVKNKGIRNGYIMWLIREFAIERM